MGSEIGAAVDVSFVFCCHCEGCEQGGKASKPDL